MKKRAAGTGRKQETTELVMGVAMQQLMLPLLLAMDATKKGLLSFVQQMGMVVLSELLATEAERIAGPKGKHIEGRTHHHWGTARRRSASAGDTCRCHTRGFELAAKAKVERSLCRASTCFATAIRCRRASPSRSRSEYPPAATSAAWSRSTRRSSRAGRAR